MAILITFVFHQPALMHPTDSLPGIVLFKGHCVSSVAQKIPWKGIKMRNKGGRNRLEPEGVTPGVWPSERSVRGTRWGTERFKSRMRTNQGPFFLLF